MSIIVRFFVAPSHAAAAAVVDGGPDGAFESSAYGNFDAEEALVEWDSLFTGRGLDELVAADEPEFVAGPEGGEGPVVFAASRALQAALAAADRIRLLEVSRRWVRQRAADGESFDPTIATGILSDLVELVRGADGPDHRLYCWMA